MCIHSIDLRRFFVSLRYLLYLVVMPLVQLSVYHLTLTGFWVVAIASQTDIWSLRLILVAFFVFALEQLFFLDGRAQMRWQVRF